MTRTEIIAKFNRELLPTLSDYQLRALAENATVLLEDHVPFFLTDHELSIVEQSREDFKHGRVLTVDEAEVRAIKHLAALD